MADISSGENRALVLDHDHRLVAGARDHLEGPELHVVLHLRVGESPTDESLGVEHGVLNSLG
jgi:hypothetical protein